MVCTSSAGLEKFIRNMSYRPNTSTHGTVMTVDLSPDHRGGQPPDPQLLALHATCSRVAHLSGAIKVLHRLKQDFRALDELGWIADETTRFDVNELLAHPLDDFASCDVHLLPLAYSLGGLM